MYRLVIIAGVLLFQLAVLGQGGDAFSNDEKTAFTSVFWEVKKQEPATDSIVRAILEKEGMSEERYGDLIQGEIEGRSVEMKKSDERVLKQIEKGNKNLRKEQNVQLKGICQNYNISVERYQEMLKQYRSNIEFQQSMRPYFKSYFNTQK